MNSDKEQIKPEIFLAVAAIAGWENVIKWSLDTTGNSYVGTLANESKGAHIPRYDRDLSAIVEVFHKLDLVFDFGRCKAGKYSASESTRCLVFWDASPAIALCKLLIAITDKPIEPVAEA